MSICDGDIYRWRYKDETPDQRGAWGRYHCKSQIAIAKDGELRDTYWGSGSDNARWDYARAERVLELTKLGNLVDLEKRPEYEAMYYDDADIVNINHSNSSRDNFYVRKGAARSREKMLATLAERIERSQQEMQFIQHRIERARETVAAIERGDDLDKVYL